MLVGRIVNFENEAIVERGKEKGFFEYGGSTIILLVKKDSVKINDDILANSGKGIESPVKMGIQIGVKQ